MANLVAVVYPDRGVAEEVLKTLRDLQRGQVIRLADACVVTKGDDGKIKLHQSVHLAGAGAAGGALWGTLIGLIFFMPLLGLAVGAASGAIGGALSDYGIDDKFMRQLGNDLEAGKAALFVLVADATPDRVLPEVSKFGGRVLHTNLSKEDEAQLQAALDAGAAAS